MKKKLNIYKEKLNYLLELPVEGDLNLFDFIDKYVDWNEFVKITDLIDVDDVEEIDFDIHGNTIRDKANPTLRLPNKKVELSNVQLLLIMRCKNDVEYFAEKFCYINTIDFGKIKIQLRNVQRKALKMFAKKKEKIELEYISQTDYNVIDKRITIDAELVKYVIVKTCRQYGKSTIYAIFLNHYIIFNGDKLAGLLANKGEVAREILSRVQLTFYHIPMWMKPGYIVWNKGNIELDNGSRIVTAGTRADAFTGYTINLLIIDEIAKLPQNIIKPLFDSLLPTIISGKSSQIIGVSTSKGDNFFKELWNRAYNNITRGYDIYEDFIPIEATFRDVPERNNNKFIKNEIRKMGMDGFLQEHVGYFLAMSDILIDNKVANRLNAKQTINDSYINKKLEKYIENISVYYSPIKGHKYIVSIDPSEMTSRSKEGDNDNIGIQILDVTDIRKKIKQVLVINFIKGFNYLDSTLILYILGTHYNNALIVGENNIGKQILNDLASDYEYDNIYSEKIENYGYRLTKSNKPMIAKIMKFLIENDMLEINDNDTILELKTFTKLLKAMSGESDGLITSLLAGLYFMTWNANKIEEIIGDESDGVYIRTGKELLKLSLDEDSEEDSELVDIITTLDYDNDLVQEILKENGFVNDSEDNELIIF
jgi:hypothetical protein